MDHPTSETWGLLMLNYGSMGLIGSAYHRPDYPSGDNQLHAHDNKRRYPSEQMIAEQDVLGKNPQTTVVVIDEVDTDNWGIGGEPVTQRRARGA